MKTAKFISTFIILLLAAGAVFLLGWVQFLVKPGNCGVMVSKTSGVYEKPIVPGTFLWRWERLLPTNAEVRVFSLAPHKSKLVMNGELPSASLYSSQLAAKPDFSYRVEISLQLVPQPEKVLEAVKNEDLKTQTDFNLWLENKSKLASQMVTDYLFKRRETELFDPKVITQDELKEIFSSSGDFDGLDFVSCEIISARIPDMALYAQGRDGYKAYQDQLNLNLAQKSKELADQMLEEERSLKQLERFGELLQKYPQLDELSKTGDITKIITALKTLR